MPALVVALLLLLACATSHLAQPGGVLVQLAEHPRPRPAQMVKATLGKQTPPTVRLHF